MTTTTAVLCDTQPQDARIVRERFLAFGARAAFSGPCCPIRLHEADGALKALLSEAGAGRVAVVEVVSRQMPAVFGEGMAKLAEQNGWAGVLIDGALRDVSSLAERQIGIRAREATPFILRDGPVGGVVPQAHFAGLAVSAEDHAVVDEDGIVFIRSALL